jgi:hypothetical protein
MKRLNRSVAGAAVIGLALLGATSSPLFAQTQPAPPSGSPTPGDGAMHAREQMIRMMDAMHGEGATERMRQAMGPDADRMIDQCAGMMGR